MKKILCLSLILVLVFMLLGCRPKNVSEPFYNAGKKAVKIADQYLSFEITADDAHQLIDSIHDALPKNGDEMFDVVVSMQLSSLSWDFVQFSVDYDDVLYDRNRLAETLGVSARK